MKTKQQKIEAIYEKIANKDLKFWCRVIIETTWLQHSCIWLDDYLGWKVKEWNLLGSEYYYLFSWECYNPDSLNFSDFKYVEWVMSVWESEEKKDTTYLYKIIWHPVMIWDVLKWISKDTIHIPDRCDYCSHELTYNAFHNEYTCPSPLCWFRFEVDNEIDDIRIYLVTELWKYLDRPIEEQDDKCIKFIYDMIKDNKKL